MRGGGGAGRVEEGRHCRRGGRKKATEKSAPRCLGNLALVALWVISSPLHPIQVLAQAPVALEEGRV